MNYQCSICPFECKVDRKTRFGVCRLPNKLLISHVQPHFFEEPFISGECESHVSSERSGGSGAIFFTGCNGRCAFCQNFQISQPDFWGAGDFKSVSDEALFTICSDLVEEKKVHNINLVSPTPYSELLVNFLKKYKKKIKVPIVWNSNGYEKVDTLKKLEGLVDVYLPDLKYFDNNLAFRYSLMPNYFDWASEAIKEMFRQAGHPQISRKGFIRKGLIIRHLVLPGYLEDSRNILDWIRAAFGKKAFVSLMSQYYPTHKAVQHPEINRTLTEDEYQKIADYFLSLDFEDGLIQDLDSADACFTPSFK